MTSCTPISTAAAAAAGPAAGPAAELRPQRPRRRLRTPPITTTTTTITTDAKAYPTVTRAAAPNLSHWAVRALPPLARSVYAVATTAAVVAAVTLSTLVATHASALTTSATASKDFVSIPLTAVTTEPDTTVADGRNLASAASVGGVETQSVVSLSRSKMLAALRSFESTRLASASSGSVSSAPLSAFPSQTEFRGTISLGTPSQEFRIIFDTGSHDTWIVSKDCSDEFCTATNTKSFDPAASSTYQNPNTAAPQIQYGDGTTVNGILALETITLISPSFVANNFIFTQATSVKTSVSVGEYDGLVGMSLPIGTNDPSPPLMSAILQSGSVSTTGALFGYYIAQGELTGTVTVGGIDKTLQADPASFPVWFDLDKSANMVQSGSWALPLASLIVGNKPFAISSGGSAASVFFDTGMALGTLPQAVYDSLAAAFPSSKKMATGSGSVDYLWQVDCATAQNASSPALVIAVTGTGYQIPLYPAEYVIDLGSSTCVIGFQVSASNLVFMGNTFFKRYYTVFDYGQRKIGFVLAKGRTANGLRAPAAASTSTAGQGNGVLYGGASSPRLSRSTLAAACAAILLIGLFEAKLYR